ncbi:MAG: sugar ABC transporter substrate-binding protein, partial [Alicyclobacillus sp.]|nr:sugar ABC transporter substrate-binding protein [Alicyclobacillus sp.]
QITVLLVENNYSKYLAHYIKDFEKLTGIQVNYLQLPESTYWSKLGVSLASGNGAYDVFMTGPSIEWQEVSAHQLEPLNSYINSPTLTSPAYNVKDFYPAFLNANRWNGVPGKGLGQGSQWAIPVMAETTILEYRKDIFAAKHLKPPATWQEWAADAAKLTGTYNGHQVYGVVQRGAKDISSINGGYYTGFASNGGVDFKGNLKPAMNSPQAVAFTKLYVDTIKKYGPPNWTNIMWYDMLQQFANGNAAMVVDNDWMTANYEDPKQSKVVGKVGFALPPAGPGGKRVVNVWTWSLAMSKGSKKKDAAWYFIQWATGKDLLLKSALAGNLDPVRKSVWTAPSVVKMTEGWGNGEWRRVVTTVLNKYAAWQPTPETQLTPLWTDWITALQAIWAGADAKQQMDQLAQQAQQLMASAH